MSDAQAKRKEGAKHDNIILHSSESNSGLLIPRRPWCPLSFSLRLGLASIEHVFTETILTGQVQDRVNVLLLQINEELGFDELQSLRVTLLQASLGVAQ